MQCFYPSQGTGDALLNVLTHNGGSDTVPAGRVSVHMASLPTSGGTHHFCSTSNAGRFSYQSQMYFYCINLYLFGFQVPDMVDYNMEHGATYRYITTDPLYPFGYGLSYTNVPLLKPSDYKIYNQYVQIDSRSGKYRQI